MYFVLLSVVLILIVIGIKFCLIGGITNGLIFILAGFFLYGIMVVYYASRHKKKRKSQGDSDSNYEESYIDYIDCYGLDTYDCDMPDCDCDGGDCISCDCSI